MEAGKSCRGQTLDGLEQYLLVEVILDDVRVGARLDALATILLISTRAHDDHGE